MKKFTILSLCLFFQFARSQDTLILQPGNEGKDAYLNDYYTTNYGDYPNAFACAGTSSGNPFTSRSIFEFDLSVIPPVATIIEARFSLYFANNAANPHYHYGDNRALLQRVIEPWDEHVVTWYNQPATTTDNQVYLPASVSGTQDYTDIDVAILIRDIVSDPENSHGFLLRIQVEEMYRRLMFASGDYAIASKRPKLEVIYTSCPIPAADFEYQADSLTYNFTGISETALTWHWDFGDGDTSNLQDPVHVFSQPGFYNVCLHVEDTCYFADHCESIEICLLPPEAGFTYSTEGLKVFFLDSSLVAGEYYWDFGDGYFSSLQNPTHIYDTSGIYQVCLMAWNSCGSDTTCRYIELCIPPLSGFDFEVEELDVYFENTSEMADEYFWDFGDGYYSNLENPWHEYEYPDNYQVCLTTWNECGEDTMCEMLYFSAVSLPEDDGEEFSIYPNPAREDVFIKSALSGNGVVILSDLSGKEVIRKEIFFDNQLPFRLELGDLQPGIYIARLQQGKENSCSKLAIIH